MRGGPLSRFSRLTQIKQNLEWGSLGEAWEEDSMKSLPAVTFGISCSTQSRFSYRIAWKSRGNNDRSSQITDQQTEAGGSVLKLQD